MMTACNRSNSINWDTEMSTYIEKLNDDFSYNIVDKQIDEDNLHAKYRVTVNDVYSFYLYGSFSNCDLFGLTLPKKINIYSGNEINITELTIDESIEACQRFMQIVDGANTTYDLDILTINIINGVYKKSVSIKNSTTNELTYIFKEYLHKE